MIGVPLEMVHGILRISLLYMAGVLAGESLNYLQCKHAVITMVPWYSRLLYMVMVMVAMVCFVLFFLVSEPKC